MRFLLCTSNRFEEYLLNLLNRHVFKGAFTSIFIRSPHKFLTVDSRFILEGNFSMELGNKHDYTEFDRIKHAFPAKSGDTLLICHSGNRTATEKAYAFCKHLQEIGIAAFPFTMNTSFDFYGSSPGFLDMVDECALRDKHFGVRFPYSHISLYQDCTESKHKHIRELIQQECVKIKAQIDASNLIFEGRNIGDCIQYSSNKKVQSNWVSMYTVNSYMYIQKEAWSECLFKDCGACVYKVNGRATLEDKLRRIYTGSLLSYKINHIFSEAGEYFTNHTRDHLEVYLDAQNDLTDEDKRIFYLDKLISTPTKLKTPNIPYSTYQTAQTLRLAPGPDISNNTMVCRSKEEWNSIRKKLPERFRKFFDEDRAVNSKQLPYCYLNMAYRHARNSSGQAKGLSINKDSGDSREAIRVDEFFLGRFRNSNKPILLVEDSSGGLLAWLYINYYIFNNSFCVSSFNLETLRSQLSGRYTFQQQISNIQSTYGKTSIANLESIARSLPPTSKVILVMDTGVSEVSYETAKEYLYAWDNFGGDTAVLGYGCASEIFLGSKFWIDYICSFLGHTLPKFTLEKVRDWLDNPERIYSYSELTKLRNEVGVVMPQGQLSLERLLDRILTMATHGVHMSVSKDSVGECLSINCGKCGMCKSNRCKCTKNFVQPSVFTLDYKWKNIWHSGTVKTLFDKAVNSLNLQIPGVPELNLTEKEVVSFWPSSILDNLRRLGDTA